MLISVKLQNLSLGTGEIEISSETGKEKDDYVLYHNFCYLASLFNVVFLCFPHSILYPHKSPLWKLLFQAYTAAESDFAMQKLLLFWFTGKFSVQKYCKGHNRVRYLPDDSVYIEHLYLTI